MVCNCVKSRPKPDDEERVSIPTSFGAVATRLSADVYNDAVRGVLSWMEEGV